MTARSSLRGERWPSTIAVGIFGALELDHAQASVGLVKYPTRVPEATATR
jgi:hypothetical protein